MRLAFGAKGGVRVTAKMLGYYAEQAAMASFDNFKIWDNFKICMLDTAQLMDSKDSLRVLKAISKVSERFTPDHFRDLLTVTYNKIESHILTMCTSDLALIADIAAKVGILDQSLSQALTIAFLSRLAQSTPGEIVTVVKSLKSLRIESEFYDEIINHLSKSHSIFPTSDLISILFCCIDCDIASLLSNVSAKISSSASKLSNEQIIKTLYLYSTNQLQTPVALSLKFEDVPEMLIPHLLFASAVYKFDIRHLKNQIIESLNNVDFVGKMVVLISLSLNVINTSGASAYVTFFRNNYTNFYQIFTDIYKNCCESCNDAKILVHLLECIGIFANIYPSGNLCELFNKILKILDKSTLSNDDNEIVEWIKTIVPYVWLCNYDTIVDDFGNTCQNAGILQGLSLKKLNVLHSIASNCVIFHKEYPFNACEVNRFNSPLIFPDLKLTLQKIAETQSLIFGKRELLLVGNVCFVPLSPIHYINGIGGFNPEFELPNTIIRQNVRNSLLELGKKYKVALIPYWKWSRITNDDERIGFINKVINSDVVLI